MNLWTCVDSSTNTYFLLLFSYSSFCFRCQVSDIRCQVSGVRCRVSPVSCHLSHVTNANSHINGPSLCKLPQYPQQDVAADLDLDSSTRSCENPKITLFFCAGIFDHFWAKIAISQTNVLPLLFSKKSLCYWLIFLPTFEDGSNKTFKKNYKCSSITNVLQDL